MRYSAVSTSLATLAVEGRALQRMRSGDIDGAALVLEESADTALMTVCASAEEGYVLTPGRAAIQQLKRVRQSTGYAPSNPIVRRAVEAALALD